MEIIKTYKVSRYYGSIPAASNISLSVEKGEIYGFIGLNGAGKTTLIRIMLGMIKPNRGSVFLFDQAVNKKFNLWNKVGYLVETPHSYPNLTVYENLKHYFYLRGIGDQRAIDEIIEKLNLHRFRHLAAKRLSLGNKQRLGLAKAMMHKPELLVLDEPINGLDPAGVVEVRQLLGELSEAGTTVFLSSHNLEEIWKVVDKVGIIHEGILIEERSKESIRDRLSRRIEMFTQHLHPSYQLLKKRAYSVNVAGEDCLTITGEKALSSPETVIEFLSKSGYPPQQFTIREENLENYFLRTIKQGNFEAA